jgi:PQQ-like domain
MKIRVVVYASLLVVIVALAGFIPGRAQEASQPAEEATSNNGQAATKNWAAGNPLKIAQLKWYQANLTTSFKVGKTENSNPYGIAFDGSSIWTANNGDGTVSKLRASDGAPLGTFAVGGSPNFVVFDGANVWVTVSPNTVSKVRASDGKILGSFTVGGAPWWPAFDGENIWVPNLHDGTLSKLRASDGKTLGTFTVPGAIAAAFDGENVWVTGYGSGKVTKLRAKDGKIVGTYSVGHNPIGVAFDGANIWVANNSDNTVTKLRASDGNDLGSFPTVGAYGVAFDGISVWVTAEPGLAEVRVSDGALIGYWNYFKGGGETTGIAFDGANIWVGNGLGDTVSKF